MTAIALQRGIATLSGSQLSLIRGTIAKDCNNEEFNLFLEIAKLRGLDPFSKQIFPAVFNKNNANRRKMDVIVTRDGLRVIAARCRNYRPAETPAVITYDPELVGPDNPKGIVSATVTLWQKDEEGRWFPVAGEALWDEFAPTQYPPSAYDRIETGDTYPDGKPVIEKHLKEDAMPVLPLESKWFKMPVIMLSKCAEAQALRAGWPEQFGGLYVEEEMERAQVLDVVATEIIERETAERREKLINANNNILVMFADALEPVAIGAFVDRVIAWVDQLSPEDVKTFAERNREAFRQFWSKNAGDALALKKHIEKASAVQVAQ